MGTEISLAIGGVNLDWSKNHRGTDHGALFQDQDRCPVRCDQIDYDYYEEESADPRPTEMAFARKLEDMMPRLELLGFTLDQARSSYDNWLKTWREEQEAIRSDGDPPIATPLSFDDFCAFANRHPLAELDDTYVDHDHRDPTGSAKGRFAEDDALVARIPTGYDHQIMAYSERSYFGGAINVLHPYLMLRILAENPVNRETDVIWQYEPLVENGWASISDFNASARRTETFLIATEGSSDAHILKHALALLRPEILDFFRFIDVSERHPFSGTGNLVKFAEGLAKIDVHNQIVFVFDNDAEGVEAFQKLGTLKLPPNMRAILLPDLDSFRLFPAKGPEGEHLADINGRAAAIECYLDLRLHNYPQPQVIWTNYKKDMGTYHGTLEHKESYAKAFLNLSADSLASSDYDTAKIAKVLDVLIAECVSIAREEIASRFGLTRE